MTMRKSSGFEPDFDSASDEPGMLILLVAAAVLAAMVSGVAELVAFSGLPVPHGITVLFGIVIGAPIGAAVSRFLRQQKSD